MTSVAGIEEGDKIPMYTPLDHEIDAVLDRIGRCALSAFHARSRAAYCTAHE
jgi:hypothetical protein